MLGRSRSYVQNTHRPPDTSLECPDPPPGSHFVGSPFPWVLVTSYAHESTYIALYCCDQSRTFCASRSTCVIRCGQPYRSSASPCGVSGPLTPPSRSPNTSSAY